MESLSTFASTSRNTYLLSSVAIVTYNLSIRTPWLSVAAWHAAAALLVSIAIGVASLIQLAPDIEKKGVPAHVLLSMRMQWYALAAYTTALVVSGVAMMG